MTGAFEIFLIIAALYAMHTLRDIHNLIAAIHKDVEAIELHLRFQEGRWRPL